MATDTATAPSPVPRVRETEDKVSYLTRWLYVWIALLVVAALTVVTFLIVISASLQDVRENVAAADRAVAAVRGNTSILPGQVNTVNSHLAEIDKNLDDIPARVSSINESLTSVNDHLTGTGDTLAGTADILPGAERSLNAADGTLGAINGSLRTTSGTLAGTESVLNSVQGLAGRVNQTLERVHAHPNDLDELPVSAGATGIYQRVAVANGVLNPAVSDVRSILNSLLSVNGHLKSTCQALVPQVLGLLPPSGGVDC